MVERCVKGDTLDKVFQALANGTRRSLMTRLAESPATVTELHQLHDVSFAGISKHLGVLADAGLVDVTKEGRRRRYRISASGLDEAASAIEFYLRFWAHRLDGLDDYLASKRDE